MMDQPIMKCIYSEEQLKEQFKLLEYVDYLQAKLAAAEAALRHDVDKIEGAYIDEMQTLREENARLKAINHTMNSDYCKEDARLRAICENLTAKLALAVERMELIASMNGRNNGCTYCAGIARETLEKIK